MDRMTITGKDGKDLMILVGDDVIVLKDHKHDVVEVDGVFSCSICHEVLEGESIVDPAS